VRRSRRLVISSILTIGNYEYGFFWYLCQDGTIAYEIKLTARPHIRPGGPCCPKPHPHCWPCRPLAQAPWLVMMGETELLARVIVVK
jgi:hypothetical protein